MLMTLPGVPSVYYGDEAGLCGERDPYNRATYPWDREDQEVMTMYRSAIALRQSDSVFAEGEFYPFFHGEIFGYIRSGGDRTHLMAFNRSAAPQRYFGPCRSWARSPYPSVFRHSVISI